ncbi:MAG: DUF2799 domain-containing protein [Gammaproteobacteria bacterium]
MRLTTLVLCALALSGCAVMSPEECQYADWQQLGEQDARQGRASDYLAKRAKACQKADIAPDADAYRAGWSRGIPQYCHVDQGFADGLAGRAYRGVCPMDLEAGFLDGYSFGQAIYQARVERDAEDLAIRQLEAELAGPADLSDPEQRELQRELDRRRDNIRVLEREVGRLEGQAVAAGFRP